MFGFYLSSIDIENLSGKNIRMAKITFASCHLVKIGQVSHERLKYSAYPPSSKSSPSKSCVLATVSVSWHIPYVLDILDNGQNLNSARFQKIGEQSPLKAKICQISILNFKFCIFYNFGRILITLFNCSYN